MAVLLAGCRNGPIEAGVDLFHGLEGGPIADQRPPPPGVDDPYPSLHTIPDRPAASDPAARERLADSLATQRDAATAAAAVDPVRALPKPAPPPKPAAPDPNANSVTVDAAPAPPPAKPAAAPPPPPVDTLASVPPVPASIASGPLPNFAAAPPAFPSGLDVPPPAAAPPPPPVIAAPVVANGVAVVFTPESSTLPPSAPGRLRTFALAHKGATLTVTGHGDAVLRTPDAQARALDLGLKRAQAIAGSLAQAGIPAGKLLIRAQATGTGGAAAL